VHPSRWAARNTNGRGQSDNPLGLSPTKAGSNVRAYGHVALISQRRASTHSGTHDAPENRTERAPQNIPVPSRREIQRRLDGNAYDRLRTAHLDEWRPATLTEEGLVLDMVNARWRLNRLQHLITAAIERQMEEERRKSMTWSSSTKNPAKT
jgi:hypothetical protein